MRDDRTDVTVILAKGWGEVKRLLACSGAAGLLLFVAGCLAVPTPPPPTEAGGALLAIGPAAQRWEEVVRSHPLGPGDNIKGVVLSTRPAVSHFLIQIRDREQPHIHREHDATVVLLRGRGRLVLKERIVALRAGDTVFIPRGAPHYYVNDAPEPTVALAIFTPSYDGTDAVVVPFEDRPEGSP
jgi:mannose-6-phosphate isomerase-like protein (cupin superfamily)